MATKKKTVKDLSIDFEEISRRVLKLEEQRPVEQIIEVKDKMNHLEVLIHQYDKRIQDLSDLINRFSQVDVMSPNITCRKCAQQFKNKNQLQQHINKEHGRSYKCEHCDETFPVSWKMEQHVKLHEYVSRF